MGIFDDELDRMKKVEICALIPIIRKTLDFISHWMQNVCVDTDITSILKKSGYEVTYEELGDYATITDRWYHLLGYELNPPMEKKDTNYYYCHTRIKYPDFILGKDNINDIEYLSTTLKFSKVEIIIIDGYPYINSIGNNILLMKRYPDEGIPDFIRFFGRPTIVLLDNTIPDKIRVRDDCIFIQYQEGYKLDNIIEEKVISYNEYCENYLHQFDVDCMQGLSNDVSKITLKTDYATTFQDLYSKTINWSITPI